MPATKQQIDQGELRAARPIMIRSLSILAAIAAFAVSAAPASANDEWRKTPPKPRFIEIGTTERLDMNVRVTATGRSAGKVAKAPTPRTVPGLGAANDLSTLGLRKALPKPRGVLDNPASGGF
jgi:hypothetical protein